MFATSRHWSAGFCLMCLSLASLLACGAVSLAQEEPAKPDAPAAAAEPPAPTLGIGDDAPPIAIDSWLHGEPLDGLKAGEIYVVEFWATWCGPCLANMPHLAELQTEYGEKVHMIGVTREETEVVEKFLEKKQSGEKLWKDVISYRLARDLDDQTSTAYMRAAQQSGIPTAFIVGRDGKVQWIGHPARMEEPLAKIVEGNWDLELARAELVKQQQKKAASRQFSVLMRAQDWDGALAVLDELETLFGEDQADSIKNARLNVLDNAGRSEEAGKLRAEMITAAWDNPQQLNAIAWGIVAGRGEKDLDSAMKAAQRAVELTESKEGATLDTLARVYFLKQDLDTALELQAKAFELEPENRTIKASFEMYKRAIEAAKAVEGKEATVEKE